MDYKIERISFNNNCFDNVIKLMKNSYPKVDKFTNDFFKWQYLDNPLGDVISFNAFYGNLLVAHYACIPIIMNINGKLEKGLLDINTATHTEHRGQGLFTRLAESTFSYAKDNGFKFVIGVANANSTHGYLKNLNFKFISPLDVKIGVGMHEFKTLPKKTFSVYWNKELLKWRLKNPCNKYSCKNNILFGDLNVPMFKTLLGNFPLNEILDSSHIQYNSIMEPFNLYIGLGMNFHNSCYVNLPKFIKRSPFNLIFRDLVGNLPEMTKDNIFFQLLDFDVA